MTEKPLYSWRNWNIIPELFTRLENLTYLLYATKPVIQKDGEVESYQLPPCKDCLAKHVLRVKPQAAIWRRSLQACPEIPNPKGHSWELESDHDQQYLTIDWMTGSPAPVNVQEDASYRHVCVS